MIDYTKIRPARSWLFFLVVWSLGLASLIAVTSEVDGVAAVAGRFTFWILHIGIGLLMTSAITRFVQQTALKRLSTPLLLLMTGLCGALAFLPMSVLLEFLLPSAFGPSGHGDFDQDVDAGGYLSALFDEFMGLAPTFLIAWILINVSYLLYTRDRIEKIDRPRSDEPHTDDQTDLSAGLLNKLKPALGHDIVMLRSDLNYVHVHTSNGRTLVLYSLSQAATELGDSGLVVHRSYWVAKNHVVSVRRQNRQYQCVMSDGSRVPVSRRRQQSVLEEFGTLFVRDQDRSID